MIDLSQVPPPPPGRDQVSGRHKGPGSRLTLFAGVFLAGIALWLVVLGLFNLRHPSDWAMGDWLINYTGGFVRRGLTGQCALLLHAVHVPLLWTILLLQWALYATVLVVVWRLAKHLRWNWWRAALFFSPATLAFALLDPPFAFRKDILFFALLALTIDPEEGSHPGERHARNWMIRSALLALGCAVCVLSHEGLIVFFPYLFAGLYLTSRDLRGTVQIFALPALVSVALFATVARFPGNAHVAQTVCSSIGGTLTTPPSGVCGGAIDYLAHDSMYAHHEVVRVMLAGHYWARAPWLFVLPLLPVVLGILQFRRTDRDAARMLAFTAALAWLLSISLFFYGTDWTRWIYVHIFSMLLLMLYAAQQQPPAAAGEEPSILFAEGGVRRLTGWALLLVYCLGWELSVYGQRPLYGSFVRFITHNLARGQQ